ncbi:MAG: hypothetical protein KIS88_10250 [Anaerolineales bacterium]|nr:hypothetical protein [Anaerolineales bacterium]
MRWWDWVSLGLEAVQAVEMDKVRTAVQGSHELQLNEVRDKQIIGHLKNVVFASSQSVKTLERQVKQKPLTGYVVAKLLEIRLEAFKIAPTIFPDIADKTYTSDTMVAIAKVRDEAESHLSASEIKKARQVISAIIEMPLLHSARESKMAAANLESTATEWTALSSKRTLFLVAAVGSLLGMPVAIFVVPFLFGGIASFLGGSDAADGAFLLGCLLPFGMPALSIVLLVLASPARYKELKQIRAAELETVKQEGSSEYDDLSIKQLDSRIAKTSAFIEEVMGDSGEADYRLLLLA